MTSDETRPRAAQSRDPEGRRRAIEEAAADLLHETGGGPITHRLVAERAGVALGSTTHYFKTLDDLRAAALSRLAERSDKALAAIDHELSEKGASPILLATLHREYLVDTAQIQRDATLNATAVQDPTLKPLATRWFDRYVDVVSRYADPHRALLLAVFLDGAAVHALLHDEPLSLETLAAAAEALLGCTLKQLPQTPPGDD